MSINTDYMRASWLEAISHGEAEGFARTFMPDILDEVDRLRALLASRDERLAAMEEAIKRERACFFTKDDMATGRDEYALKVRTQLRKEILADLASLPQPAPSQEK